MHYFCAVLKICDNTPKRKLQPYKGHPSVLGLIGWPNPSQLKILRHSSPLCVWKKLKTATDGSSTGPAPNNCWRIPTVVGRITEGLETGGTFKTLKNGSILVLDSHRVATQSDHLISQSVQFLSNTGKDEPASHVPVSQCVSAYWRSEENSMVASERQVPNMEFLFWSAGVHTSQPSPGLRNHDDDNPVKFCCWVNHLQKFFLQVITTRVTTDHCQPWNNADAPNKLISESCDMQQL